jgi:hypothetical protein
MSELSNYMLHKQRSRPLIYDILNARVKKITVFLFFQVVIYNEACVKSDLTW